jgi:hypothetical protein
MSIREVNALKESLRAHPRSDLSDDHRLLLFLVADSQNQEKGYAWASWRAVRGYTGWSADKLERVRRDLHERDLLSWDRVRGNDGREHLRWRIGAHGWSKTCCQVLGRPERYLTPTGTVRSDAKRDFGTDRSDAPHENREELEVTRINEKQFLTPSPNGTGPDPKENHVRRAARSDAERDSGTDRNGSGWRLPAPEDLAFDDLLAD